MAGICSHKCLHKKITKIKVINRILQLKELVGKTKLQTQRKKIIKIRGEMKE